MGTVERSAESGKTGSGREEDAVGTVPREDLGTGVGLQWEAGGGNLGIDD